MRNILFILLFSTLSACAQTTTKVPTIPITISKPTFDSCSWYRRQNDTLLHKLYISNKRLTKVVFYSNICIKNPKQIKFLKGWIRRTMEN